MIKKLEIESANGNFAAIQEKLNEVIDAVNGKKSKPSTDKE